MHADTVEPGDTPAAAPAAAPAPARAASRRGIAAIGILVIALVAVVGGILVLGNRPPAAYPAGSPEAAFQAYLVAWDDGDLDAAYAAFSREVRADVTLADYRTMASGSGQARTSRVVLEEVDVTGDRAMLALRVDYPGGGGLFGGGTWSQDYTVALVREDGDWRIDEPLLGVEPQPWWKY